MKKEQNVSNDLKGDHEEVSLIGSLLDYSKEFVSPKLTDSLTTAIQKWTGHPNKGSKLSISKVFKQKPDDHPPEISQRRFYFTRAVHTQGAVTVIANI